jgi:hypothetical protein
MEAHCERGQSPPWAAMSSKKEQKEKYAVPCDQARKNRFLSAINEHQGQ